MAAPDESTLHPRLVWERRRFLRLRPLPQLLGVPAHCMAVLRAGGRTRCFSEGAHCLGELPSGLYSRHVVDMRRYRLGLPLRKGVTADGFSLPMQVDMLFCVWHPAACVEIDDLWGQLISLLRTEAYRWIGSLTLSEARAALGQSAAADALLCALRRPARHLGLAILAVTIPNWEVDPRYAQITRVARRALTGLSLQARQEQQRQYVQRARADAALAGAEAQARLRRVQAETEAEVRGIGVEADARARRVDAGMREAEAHSEALVAAIRRAWQAPVDEWLRKRALEDQAHERVLAAIKGVAEAMSQAAMPEAPSMWGPAGGRRVEEKAAQASAEMFRAGLQFLQELLSREKAPSAGGSGGAPVP